MNARQLSAVGVALAVVPGCGGNGAKHVATPTTATSTQAASPTWTRLADGSSDSDEAYAIKFSAKGFSTFRFRAVVPGRQWVTLTWEVDCMNFDMTHQAKRGGHTTRRGSFSVIRPATVQGLTNSCDVRAWASRCNTYLSEAPASCDSDQPGVARILIDGRRAEGGE